MLTKAQSIQKSRLGNILLQGHYITSEQLKNALQYQLKRKIKLGTALVELKLLSRRQLNFALRKQSWTRAIAASIALAIAPFSNAIASEKSSTAHIASHQSKSIPANSYVNDIQLSTRILDKSYHDYFYTGKDDALFSLNKSFSSKAGISISLHRSNLDYQGSDFSYHFEPQISLFKSSSKPSRANFSQKGIGKGLNRTSNTQPIVYMLTIKGRSVFENSNGGMKFWTLDSAKKGVQRKTQLMFSVTKQF